MIKDIYAKIVSQLKDDIKNFNLGRIFMKLVVVLLLIGGIFGGCSYINEKLGLRNDNIIEEAIEKKIEDATGLNLDLSPEDGEDF